MSTIGAEGLYFLIESAPDGFFVHDAAGRILEVNARACTDLGYAHSELVGMSINDLSCSAALAENARLWAEAQPGMSETLRRTVLRKDGSAFPVEVRLACQMVDGRKLFFGFARDISEREPLQEHGRLALAARVGGLGIWDYDLARDELDCDEQWYRIMGRDSATPVRTVQQFKAFIHPEDVDRATEVEGTAARLAADGQDYGITFRIVRPDGEIRWVRSAASLIHGAGGKPSRAVGFIVDITESRLAEERLRQSNLSLQQEKEALNQHSEELRRKTLEDPLTGIANRRCLDLELERTRLHAIRTRQPLALALIDVDFFKLYNDHHGHLQGDAALKAVAAILTSCLRRPYDLAARYGGEEFVVLLPGNDRPEAILQKIASDLAALQLAHEASPIGPHLTISCGCVVASQLERFSAAELLSHSDLALYRAKEAGRNRVEVVRL